MTGRLRQRDHVLTITRCEFDQPPFHLIIFFFNDTATTEIYTLSLHDALPILYRIGTGGTRGVTLPDTIASRSRWQRSEEHTSELQSRLHLVCRLLLEKKKDSVTSLARRRAVTHNT